MSPKAIAWCNIHKCNPSDCYTIHWPGATMEFQTWKIHDAIALLLRGNNVQSPAPRV